MALGLRKNVILTAENLIKINSLNIICCRYSVKSHHAIKSNNKKTIVGDAAICLIGKLKPKMRQKK